MRSDPVTSDEPGLGAGPVEPDPTPCVRLCGVDFVDAPLQAVVERLDQRAADLPFGYVVTPNADHLARLPRLPDMPGIYDHALLRLLDSRVVARFARLLGLEVPQVLPGSDLTAALMRDIIRPEEAVTIVGMPAEAVEVLARRYGLRQVAHHNPPMGFDRDPAAFEHAVRFVEDHPARFVFLAVGAPRQCRLAHAVWRRGRARGIGLCIGASLLFLSGHERRAPNLLQRAGLEWAWRLALDPRRLARRYFVDSPRVFATLLEEARLRRSGSEARQTRPPASR